MREWLIFCGRSWLSIKVLSFFHALFSTYLLYYSVVRTDNWWRCPHVPARSWFRDRGGNVGSIGESRLHLQSNEWNRSISVSTILISHCMYMNNFLELHVPVVDSNSCVNCGAIQHTVHAHRKPFWLASKFHGFSNLLFTTSSWRVGKTPSRTLCVWYQESDENPVIIISRTVVEYSRVVVGPLTAS